MTAPDSYANLTLLAPAPLAVGTVVRPRKPTVGKSDKNPAPGRTRTGGPQQPRWSLAPRASISQPRHSPRITPYFITLIISSARYALRSFACGTIFHCAYAHLTTPIWIEGATFFEW